MGPTEQTPVSRADFIAAGMSAEHQRKRAEKAIELLAQVHSWFMEVAPTKYRPCGLWMDVEAFLGREQ